MCEERKPETKYTTPFPTIIGFISFVIAAGILLSAITLYGIPWMERNQDRRFIERQYEREAYRKEYEQKIGYNQGCEDSK